MTSKHDTLVELVVEELKVRGYTDIHKFEDYKSKGYSGEIDLYTITDNYILLFEIKCTPRGRHERKAREQLDRATEYFLPKDKRVFKFYVYGCGKDDYHIVWER